MQRCLQITPVGDWVGLAECMYGEPPARFEECTQGIYSTVPGCCRRQCKAFNGEEDDDDMCRESAFRGQDFFGGSAKRRRKRQCMIVCYNEVNYP